MQVILRILPALALTGCAGLPRLQGTGAILGARISPAARRPSPSGPRRRARRATLGAVIAAVLAGPPLARPVRAEGEWVERECAERLRDDDAAALRREAIDLGETRRRVITKSPALAARCEKLRVRDALMIQAGLRPNPEIEAEVEEFAGTGDLSGLAAAETTLLARQRLETSGKRSKRQGSRSPPTSSRGSTTRSRARSTSPRRRSRSRTCWPLRRVWSCSRSSCGPRPPRCRPPSDWCPRAPPLPSRRRARRSSSRRRRSSSPRRLFELRLREIDALPAHAEIGAQIERLTGATAPELEEERP